MQLPFVESPNKWNNRKGHAVRAIVVHVCDGNFRGCLDWTTDEVSQVSYHYIVRRDGHVVQTVKNEHAAWHAGRVVSPTWDGILDGINPNLYTIGIARSGFGSKAPSVEQFVALCALLGRVADEVGVRLNADTVVFHREIHSGKTCPGVGLHKATMIAIATMFQMSGLYDVFLSRYQQHG